MSIESTQTYSLEDLGQEIIKSTLLEVMDALREKGYNPIDQIVGYIISGDPGFISSYRDSRRKIISIDRSQLTATILKGFIK